MFYQKLFAILNKNNVQFLVAGGVAVALHGALRMTADLDIFISLDPENIRKFVILMTQNGFQPRVPVPPEDFIDPEKRKHWKKDKNMMVFTWVNKEHPTEIVDVFIDEPKPFKELYDRRLEAQTAQGKVPLVSIEDLIALKQNTGRQQDAADVQALKRIRL
jgi:hypothetical protein